MTSGEIPDMSAADHAKTSAFRRRALVSSSVSSGFSLELILTCFSGFWSSRAIEKSSSIVSALTIFSSSRESIVSRDKVLDDGGQSEAEAGVRRSNTAELAVGFSIFHRHCGGSRISPGGDMLTPQLGRH